MTRIIIHAHQSFDGIDYIIFIFGSIGELIPLLIGTGIPKVIIKFNMPDGIAWMQSMDWIRIGYFSLGLAAVFVSYDKLFGYSSF